MTRPSRARFALSAIGAVLLVGAAPNLALAQSGAQSWAVAIGAKFRAGGVATQLRPIASVSGASSPTYDKSQAEPPVDERLVIAPGDPAPTLIVTGHGVSARASGSWRSPTTRASRGDVSLDAVGLVLTGTGAGSAAARASPDLEIAALELTASVFFTPNPGRGGDAIGLMNVGALTLSGALLDGTAIRRTGQIGPNTVIYRSPTVTITLNRQVKSGPMTCDEECVEAPLGAGVGVIRMVAIDVELRGALVGRAKVSGEIKIGEAAAR